MAATLYRRLAEAALITALADTPVVLIHGPRQCGKTTLALQVGKRRRFRYYTFDDTATLAAIMQIEEAKQVCRRCDVREQCLAWALEAGQDHGVWGGLSEDERRALKRRNARARIRTA